MNRQYSALSGVAIALIVLNHAIHFGLQVSPVEGAWLATLTVLQALGAFAVPAFLFVSGAFVSYAAGGLSLTFVRSSLERILWPYLIWSAAFYALAFTTGAVRATPAAYVKDLLVGYPYHFVPLLIFWYLVSPFLVRVARRHGTWLVAGIGLYQALLLALRYPGIFGSWLLLPARAHLLAPPVLFTPLSDWAVYFPLGLVLSLHNARAKPVLLRFRAVAAAACACLFALGLLNAAGVVSAPWARFAAPLPLMFVLPTIDRASIPLLGQFEFLGRRSYGIYLAHFVLINVVVLAGRIAPVLGRFPAVVYPALLVAALGLPLLLMDLMTRSRLARRAYRYAFGIVPPAA